MAVVKIKYTRQRGVVKAHIRYITHRRDRDGRAISRSLFTEEGTLSKDNAYQMIDKAKRGVVFYKIVISPDPKREDSGRDLDLWSLTSQTMHNLGLSLQKNVRFIAVEHNDHSLVRHVHAVCLIQGRLSRPQFRMLAKTARQAATHEALQQRKARDLVSQNGKSRQFRYVRASFYDNSRRGRGERAKLSPRLQSGCRSCGYGELTGVPGFLRACPLCGVTLGRVRRVYLGRGEYL